MIAGSSLQLQVDEIESYVEFEYWETKKCWNRPEYSEEPWRTEEAHSHSDASEIPWVNARVKN